MENTYYGRMTKCKPANTVEIFMLDEYIQRILKKNSKKYEKDLASLLIELKKSASADIVAIKKQISEINKKLTELIGKRKSKKGKSEANEMEEVKRKVALSLNRSVEEIK